MTSTSFVLTTAQQVVLARDVRQREIVPPEKLAECRALVIGVGAIGRQVAIQLAAVGVRAIDLIDPDVVEVVNLAPQAYYEADVGQPKVVATAAACRMLNTQAEVTTHQQRFRRSSSRTLAALTDSTARCVVFCCVDSIFTRELVWQTVRQRAAFFADGRMSAEVVRVVAAADAAADAYYATTLFSAEQAYRGSCTARSTVYTACIAAGVMLSAFTRWLRGLPVERDVTLNLLAGELHLG